MRVSIGSMSCIPNLLFPIATPIEKNHEITHCMHRCSERKIFSCTLSPAHHRTRLATIGRALPACENASATTKTATRKKEAPMNTEMKLEKFAAQLDMLRGETLATQVALQVRRGS
jgi:hypothetical protein